MEGCPIILWSYPLVSGPVHMIPGQLIAPVQLTDPVVNFTSVHGLTPITVHMSFWLPRGNFERRVIRCTTLGNSPCRGNLKDYHQFHNNPSRCECNTSSHLYEPYGHVITGDLSVIPDSKLRDLIAKGPKYREPCKIDWDKNLSLLYEAVDQYALQWAKREIVELSVLSSWKEMVKGQTDHEERISKLKQNFKQPTGKVLQNVDVKHVYLTYVINMFLYQQIKLQTIS